MPRQVYELATKGDHFACLELGLAYRDGRRSVRGPGPEPGDGAVKETGDGAGSQGDGKGDGKGEGGKARGGSKAQVRAGLGRVAGAESDDDSDDSDGGGESVDPLELDELPPWLAPNPAEAFKCRFIISLGVLSLSTLSLDPASNK